MALRHNAPHGPLANALFLVDTALPFSVFTDAWYGIPKKRFGYEYTTLVKVLDKELEKQLVTTVRNEGLGHCRARV